MQRTLFKGASSVAIILVLIIAVVAAFFILPGFISNNGTPFSFAASPGTQGVVIKSLTADQTSVYGGSIVDLELVTQNVGGSAATNVNAQLYGLSSSGWTVSPSNSQQISGGTLYGADQSSGLKGAQGVVDWTLTAPASQATSITYPGIVYVTYTYSTVSNVVMQIATNDFLKTSSIAPGISSQKYTLGPISVTATLAIPPIITVTSSGPNPSSIPIQFDIENIGGGGAYLNSTNDQSVSVRVSSNVNCPVSGTVRLISGKSRILTCTIPVSDISSSNPFEQKILTFTVNYNYYVQSPVSITVLNSLSGLTQGGSTSTTTTQCPSTAGITANFGGSTFQPGTSVNAQITVDTQACQGSTVKLYDVINQNTVGTYSCSLSGATSPTCTIAFTMPSTVGTYYYRAFVDVGNNGVYTQGTDPISAVYQLNVKSGTTSQ